MKNIIVTGSAGFIGQHLIKALKDRGDYTIGVDLKKHVIKPSVVVEGNLAFVENYPLDEIDAYIHLAATASVQESLDHPADVHFNNTDVMLKSIEDAKNLKAKRYVFASSAAVYGDQYVPLVESTTPKPMSPYGAQKLIGEHYCDIYNKLFDLSTIALRFFNVYGEGQNPDYAGVIKAFLDARENDENFKIYGDGIQTRCFVYVGDVVDAILKAIDSEETGVFNVADPLRISVKGIADMIRPDKSKADFLPERPGDIKHVTTSISKTKNLLGWEPKTSLNEWLKTQV